MHYDSNRGINNSSHNFRQIGHMSIKKVLTGAGSISVANSIRIAVQFFAFPVMARLLSPTEYGLAAMAMPIILLVMTIADSGLAASLVRVDPKNSSEWHSCFWLSFGLGCGFALILSLASPLIAMLLEQPRLAEIIPALGTILPLQMLAVVPSAALQRQGRFGRIASVEIFSIFASVSLAVLSASYGAGVWALVLQQVIYFFLRTAGTFIISDYSPRFKFNISNIKSHMKFGRSILLTNMINFGSRTSESSIIGRSLGPEILGIYAMAFQFARMPSMLITGPLNYVLYPQISRIRHDPAGVKSMFILTTKVLALLFFPAIAVAAAANGPIFHLLLSDKWSRAGLIFMLVAPATAIQCVSNSINVFLMAMGRTDIQVRLATLTAGLWMAAMCASIWFGIEIVAISYSVCILVMFVWTLRQALPILNCTVELYLRCLHGPLLVATLDTLLYYFGSSQLPNLYLSQIGLAAAIVIGSLLASFVIQRVELKRQFHMAGQAMA